MADIRCITTGYELVMSLEMPSDVPQKYFSRGERTIKMTRTLFPRRVMDNPLHIFFAPQMK